MATVELVELGALTAQDWADLVADEPEPFGPVGAGLKWRPKDRHVALRLDDGRLVAVAGAVVAEVAVADVSAFDVVGIGGVIVTRPRRGQGLLERLMDPLLRLAGERCEADDVSHVLFVRSARFECSAQHESVQSSDGFLSTTSSARLSPNSLFLKSKLRN